MSSTLRGRALAHRAAALLLVAAVAWVYAPVRDHGFLLYDDDLYLVRNPHLASGLSAEGLRFALTSFYGANWFPLTWLSHLAEWELHRLDPGRVHLANLALHLGVVALVGLCARALGLGSWAALFSAGLFGLHPVAVESVAWATERKGLLAAFFTLLAVRIHAGAGRESELPEALRRRRTSVRVAATTLAGAAALLAKPVAVTLPGALLLLDAWPLRRLQRQPLGALAEKLPLLLLAAGATALTVRAQAGAGTVVPLSALPLDARLANAVASVLLHLRHFLWPSGLAVFYPHPAEGFGAPAAAGALALLAGTALGVAAARRHPHPFACVLVGWLWYLGTLSPTLGLVQVGSQATADRYAYLPLAGLAVGAGALCARAASRLRTRGPARLLPACAALALLVALGVRTREQVALWRDTETLFRHALAVTGPNAVGLAHLAGALEARGAVEEAIAHYEQACALAPADPVAANNLAWLLATHPDPDRRDPERAETGRDRGPDDARCLSDRAVAIARDAARRARELGRPNPELLDTLAVAYAAAGRTDDAIRTARAAEALFRGRGRLAEAEATAARRRAWAASRGARASGSAGPRR